MGYFTTLTVNNENDGKSLEVFVNTDNAVVMKLNDGSGEEFLFEFQSAEDIEILIKELRKLKNEI